MPMNLISSQGRLYLPTYTMVKEHGMKQKKKSSVTANLKLRYYYDGYNSYVNLLTVTAG